MMNLSGIAALALALACCSLSPAPPGPVEVRIANESSYDFEGVVVSFPDQVEEYGAVAARRQSEYRRVVRAYRYAPISVEVDGEELRLQPIDYVGETLLASGRYSYVINVDPPSGSLSLALRPDD
jgi:hypothetical protein